MTIHYTLNGATPTAASPVYNPATGIIVNGSETVAAIAMAPGYINSVESAKAYIVP